MPAGTAAAATPRSHHGWALVVLLVGAILPPLDYFIVNLALPAIRDGIGARPAELQLVVSAYACANAVVQITGGRLGDLYGRKRMFMIGMAGFVVASTLCGARRQRRGAGRRPRAAGPVRRDPRAAGARDDPQRVHPQEQVRVMGFYGFVFGLAAVIGQLGGGALISLHPFGPAGARSSSSTCRSASWLLIGSWRFIPESRPPKGQRIDVPGMVLLSLFLLMLVYPLTHGREAGWPLWMVACLVGALPMLGALLAVEARRLAGGHDPLLDVRLFRNPVVALELVLAFLFYTLSAFFLSYGIYLQGCLNWSPLASGLAILPLSSASCRLPLLMPRLVGRFGGYRVLTLGFAMLAAGVATAAALAGAATPGIGFTWGSRRSGSAGPALPSVVRIVLAEVDTARAGVASGMVTAMLQIGAAVGAATLGGVFFARLGAHPAALDYVQGFRTSMFALTAVLLVCIALSALLGPLHRRLHAGR